MHDVALVQREIESKREHFSVFSLTGTNYWQPATYPNPLKESTASKVREFHLHIGFKTPWDIFAHLHAQRSLTSLNLTTEDLL